MQNDTTSKIKTFKELIFDGKATYKDFDDYVDEWHASKSSLPLHEYLELTRQQYHMLIAPELYTSFVLLKDPVISAAFPNLLKLTETAVQCYKKDEELEEIKVILDETK